MMSCDLNVGGRRRNYSQGDLMLEKSINIGVTMEMASKEAPQLNAKGRVHKFSSGKPNIQGPCFHCGKSGHLASACWGKDLYVEKRPCRTCMQKLKKKDNISKT